MTWVDASLFLLAMPLLATSGYLFMLVLASRRPSVPAAPPTKLRFDLIVPAHDEESGIARTVRSLLAVHYPAALRRVLVIADNCTDNTADIARTAGATVLERNCADQRGKGYALAYAFEHSRTCGFADVVVIVDADAEVSSNLLEAFASRIEGGAHAVQAHYGVRNPFTSWRTRLITIAQGSFHIVRARARERLKLSCGIRGNGWCVTHELLRQVPYRAFSLTEDLEYGIDLGLAGFRAAYADEAHANADMVSGAKAAGQQRERWEVGRFQLMRSKTLPLLRAAASRGDAICLDLALDLLVLPLSYIFLDVAALLFLAELAVLWHLSLAHWLLLGGACACCLCLHVLRGWQLSGTGAQGLLDLAGAPYFLLWKLLLMMQRHKSVEWLRTEREKPKP